MGRKKKKIQTQEVIVNTQPVQVSSQVLELQAQYPDLTTPEIEKIIQARKKNGSYHVPQCPFCGEKFYNDKRFKPYCYHNRGGVHYIKCRRCLFTWKD